MQPNQNPMGAPAVGGMPGAAAPSMPASPVEPAMPNLTVKEEIPEVPSAPVVANKKGHGMLIGMVLLALIAAGGVGFGVYMYMEKGKVETNLNKQIKDLRETITSLQEQNAKDAEDEDEDEPVSSDTLQLEFTDYGLKVSFPNTIASASYSKNIIGAYCVNGYTNKGSGEPSFATNENSSVCLYRTEAKKPDEVVGTATPSFTIDGYDYYVFSPQTVATTVTDEAAWEEESVKLIADTLKNIENYTEL